MSNLLPFVSILHDFATDLTFLSFSEESISRIRSSVIKRQSASSLPVDLFTFLNSVFNRLFPCRVAFPKYGDQQFRRGFISRLLIFFRLLIRKIICDSIKFDILPEFVAVHGVLWFFSILQLLKSTFKSNFFVKVHN